MDSLTTSMGSLRLPTRLAKASDRQHEIAIHVRFLEQEKLQNEVRAEWGASMFTFQTIKTATTCTAPNSSLPVVPILSKNLITIVDILRKGADEVHRGKVFLCRSILPTFKINALSLLVDDPDGKYVLRLALYNFSKTVPVGTVLAIMQPWFKYTADGSASLRCENPMHVYFVKSTDSILQNVIWKADLPVESGVKLNAAAIQCKSEHDNPANQGTRYFMEKNYTKALEMYTKAIELNPKNPILFSNRALTNLALQKPLEALADAEMGISLDKSHLKSLYRKAKALLMLKRYRHAVDFLDETLRRLKKELDGNLEFTKLMKNSRIMLLESETGIYDLMQINEEAKRCKFLENHADYAAWSKFKIKNIAGKGRGLVATRDMPVGTHVMVCKAFAFNSKTKDKLVLATNPAAETMEDIGYTALVQQICDKLMANPEVGRDFYQLYAGPTLGVLGDYDPLNPVDVDRISAIVRTNSFAAADQFFENGFAAFTGYLPKEEMSKCRGFYESVMRDSGLWLLPSYMNHSCADYNCIWITIGDFMFVRTSKMIKRGEELLISYIPPDKSFEERSRACENHWGFVCGCSLCVADRQCLG